MTPRIRPWLLATPLLAAVGGLGLAGCAPAAYASAPSSRSRASVTAALV